MSSAAAKTLVVTLKRSLIGVPHKTKAVALSLGLRRVNQTVERPNNPAIRGQLWKVKHLVDVKTDEQAASQVRATLQRLRRRAPAVATHQPLTQRSAPPF
mmetsp:Transcript_5925/g.21656  ORF Transcript_5925/g.21656 Transcript_5925/m.21656 type:complete len:100 (+) Transcript_5925:89-388(+)